MFRDSKWFQYFIPPKSSFSNIREYEKSILLLQSLPIFGVLVFISLLQKGIVTGELSYPHILGIISLSFIPIILKFTKNFRLSASILIAAGMILVPINSINEGGFHSNGISWFGIIPIVSIFFLGPNVGLWIAFTAIIELIFIGLLHNYDQIPMIQSELANSYSYRAISTLSLVIFSTVFARLYEKQSLKSEEELKRASDVAEAAIQEKNTFWTTISHEIKTPLNGILGLSEVMMGSSLSNDQREYLSHIKDSAEALNLILRDVIDFSQLDKGEIKLMKSPSELRAMLDQLVSLFSFSASSKGIQLSWIADHDIPDTLILDEKRLSQVLSNLVSNAIKFTSRGHVKIIVEHEQRKNQYKFTVEDTGLGIDREQLSTLFIPFRQKSENNGQQWGTGLGLAICQRLCMLMGTGIIVRSSIGKGSRFSFVLEAQPIQMSSPEKTQRIQAPLLKRGSDSYILVAEDNLINQKLLSNHLDKLGYRFKIVSNGLEAFNAAVEENFDLILMDIQMPIMNGIASSQKIKETLRERAPKVIAVSANVVDIEKENLQQSGIIDFLAKPISLHSLRISIKKHCDYYQDPRVLYKELEKKDAVLALVTNNKESSTFVDKEQLLEHFEYDIELIQTLKDQFQMRFSQAFEELDQAIELNDYETIRMSAHSLKGAISNFFCDPLRNCALAIEQKASVHDSDGLLDLLNSLKNDVPKLIEEINEIIIEQETLRRESALKKKPLRRGA